MKDPFKMLGLIDKFLNWFMWALGTVFCTELYLHQGWDTVTIGDFGTVIFCCGLYYFWKKGSFIRFK